jgi:hypothetical protein
LPIAGIGEVTRAESGSKIEIPLRGDERVLSPLDLFEVMRFPAALQVAELLTMGLPPAVEDKMCAKVNGVQAKSQLAVRETTATEGNEELV